MRFTKIVVAFFLLMLAARSGLVLAGATPTATPEASTKQKQIEDLKERLATKVAELRSLTRRAIAGTTKTISLSSFTVETATKDIKIELTDDIKVIQYLKGSRTKLTVDDLDKGDNVVVFGEYETTLDLLRAKVIFIQAALPIFVSGTVTEIDKDEFTLTLTTPDAKNIIVDIEKYTKTQQWTSGSGITKSGFSKINLGDTLHVVATPAPKKENRVSALRILDLGNLTGAPTPTPTPTATPKPTATP
ncbi:MAG: hypothetical protein ACOY0S_02215 [Patescibacteria group bacterium]